MKTLHQHDVFPCIKSTTLALKATVEHKQNIADADKL